MGRTGQLGWVGDASSAEVQGTCGVRLGLPRRGPGWQLIVRGSVQGRGWRELRVSTMDPGVTLGTGQRGA